MSKLDIHLAAAEKMLLDMPQYERYVQLNRLLVRTLSLDEKASSGRFLADTAISVGCDYPVMAELLRDIHPGDRAEMLLDLAGRMSNRDDITLSLSALIRKRLAHRAKGMSDALHT